ncbi:MAG: carboxypeptidase regulatory-like domain-containing protein, partial [Gemmatimonadales bacterium]|nr:carboxypeptidase regulatory-like domain-containing protein [Gemmatimonadales bacterium]
GEPVGGGRVIAYWAPGEGDSGVDARGLEVETDPDGGFLVCGVPVGRNYSLVATLPGRAASIEGLRSVADSVVDIDLSLRPVGADSAFARLEGRVSDAKTGAGLALAEVEVLPYGLRAMTDGGGAFRMDRLPAGAANVTVRRIGYRPRFLSMELKEGATATLAEKLVSAPNVLPDVEVKGTAGRMTRHGFLEREKLGFGVFWSGEELTRLEGRKLNNVLAGRTSVRTEGPGANAPLINTSRGRRCRIPIAVDGVLFIEGSGQRRGGSPGASALDLFQPEDLSGIEFYNSRAVTPVELQHLGTDCGLIALWTK